MSEPFVSASEHDATSMNEAAITLGANVWYYMPSRPLGPAGGFGEVFLGRSSQNKPIAVKRIKLSAAGGAHRELKMAEYLVSGNFKNVMPILDSGQDTGSGTYFIIMPVADESLQDEVNKATHDSAAATEILLQVTNGLLEVSDIVHRDLKPGNILLHAGTWKITDFGIARFADAATSSDTLRDNLSAYYAAPEQWRLERATSATDVYALGCIGYALITGTPPFTGSTRDELRAHHLGSDPPVLSDAISAKLRTLLSSMLRKAPESRPTLSKVQASLKQLVSSDNQNLGAKALAEAAAKIEGEHAARERQSSIEAMARNDREYLAKTGRAILAELKQQLLAVALEAAPNANCSRDGEVALGSGVLHLPSLTSKVLSPGLFIESAWNVVLGEAVGVVRNGTGRDQGYVISASLWYAKLPASEQYRWYEASYWRAC